MLPEMNQTAFYDAFEIKPRDKMYLPPEKRAAIGARLQAKDGSFGRDQPSSSHHRSRPLASSHSLGCCTVISFPA
jgi:hypothetical protein